jgi:hypothetical protein
MERPSIGLLPSVQAFVFVGSESHRQLKDIVRVNLAPRSTAWNDGIPADLSKVLISTQHNSQDGLSVSMCAGAV